LFPKVYKTVSDNLDYIRIHSCVFPLISNETEHGVSLWTELGRV